MLEALGCDALGFGIGILCLIAEVVGWLASEYRQSHDEIDGHF